MRPRLSSIPRCVSTSRANMRPVSLATMTRSVSSARLGSTPSSTTPRRATTSRRRPAPLRQPLRVTSVASEERPAPATDRRDRAPPPPDAYVPPSVTLTRGQLVRKDVVTRTTGVRLGTATNLWVDVDEWEVVALDVRPYVRGALLNGVGGGAVDHVLMSSLRQVGDVILVHDESAVERRWSSYGLSTVVGCDVVTERGTYIGRVRDYEFDPDDGLVQRIVVDALGLPIVPEGVVSTYAVDVGEILSVGMDRIILAEGAESRVEQLSASLLQRLQLTAPPWEDDLATYADYYEADVRARQQAEWERQQAWAQQGYQQRGYQQQARYNPTPRTYSEDYYSAPPPPAAGIPLVRPNQPYERRDADGGYGDRPPQGERRGGASGGGRAIGDWMVRDNEQRANLEYEYEYADGGYGYASETNGRGTRGDTNRRVESPPPPPADAWARAAPERGDAGARSISTGGTGGGATAAPPSQRKGFDADEDML